MPFINIFHIKAFYLYYFLLFKFYFIKFSFFNTFKRTTFERIYPAIYDYYVLVESCAFLCAYSCAFLLCVETRLLYLANDRKDKNYTSFLAFYGLKRNLWGKYDSED